MAELLNDNFETGEFLPKWTSLGDYEETPHSNRNHSGCRGPTALTSPTSSGAELIKELAVSKAEIFGAHGF